jgi:Arc/MetJ-type ribon-helix-helix transcriptional regulator
MTIHLPNELESSIQEAVRRGRFASVDDAMAEAARLLLRELARGQQVRPAAGTSDSAHDPILGLMRDDADLMDGIVADAYRQRREETWRELDLGTRPSSTRTSFRKSPRA